MPALRDVVAVLDELYDPRWADDWDAVGTVVGDPDADVSRDPVRRRSRAGRRRRGRRVGRRPAGHAPSALPVRCHVRRRVLTQGPRRPRPHLERHRPAHLPHQRRQPAARRLGIDGGGARPHRHPPTRGRRGRDRHLGRLRSARRRRQGRGGHARGRRRCDRRVRPGHVPVARHRILPAARRSDARRSARSARSRASTRCASRWSPLPPSASRYAGRCWTRTRTRRSPTPSPPRRRGRPTGGADASDSCPNR